jgi:hypothetical protein
MCVGSVLDVLDVCMTLCVRCVLDATVLDVTVLDVWMCVGFVLDVCWMCVA